MTAFSAEIRNATAAAHEEAESEGFVAQLMDGRLSEADFAAMLLQNLVIYRALERALRANDDARLAAFADPALDRTAALESDMRHHFGADWEARLAAGDLPVVQAAREYARQLEEGAGSAELLLANHYVRYLGDLSGGQIIARRVQQHYGTPDEGLAFYRFPQIPKTKPYKDAYRAKLDAAEFTRAEQEEILRRAVEAFELNRRVFADLGAARLPQG